MQQIVPNYCIENEMFVDLESIIRVWHTKYFEKVVNTSLRNYSWVLLFRWMKKWKKIGKNRIMVSKMCFPIDDQNTQVAIVRNAIRKSETNFCKWKTSENHSQNVRCTLNRIEIDKSISSYDSKAQQSINGNHISQQSIRFSLCLFRPSSVCVLFIGNWYVHSQWKFLLVVYIAHDTIMT